MMTTDSMGPARTVTIEKALEGSLQCLEDLGGAKDQGWNTVQGFDGNEKA